jgi:hypothetical protein
MEGSLVPPRIFGMDGDALAVRSNLEFYILHSGNVFDKYFLLAEQSFSVNAVIRAFLDEAV